MSLLDIRLTLRQADGKIGSMYGTIVDLRINETLQTGAVRNRTYRGHSPDFSNPDSRGFLTAPTGGESVYLFL